MHISGSKYNYKLKLEKKLNLNTHLYPKLSNIDSLQTFIICFPYQQCFMGHSWGTWFSTKKVQILYEKAQSMHKCNHPKRCVFKITSTSIIELLECSNNQKRCQLRVLGCIIPVRSPLPFRFTAATALTDVSSVSFM